jgi:OHCU decarboxylase
MPRALFVEVFGDIFEHMPQIAEAAHRAGIGRESDTAAGLHSTLVAAMRGLPEDAKRTLVLAHPDLGVRLSRETALTANSAKEQSAAGLDQLSATERERFLALNQAYVDRFGFPFILAVKGLTKQDILQAFEARLRQDQGAEWATALQQIERIALLRLQDRLPP